MPISQPQVHFWLLANNHYIHGAYILEIVKDQWEHNTIKGARHIHTYAYMCMHTCNTVQGKPPTEIAEIAEIWGGRGGSGVAGV